MHDREMEWMSADGRRTKIKDMEVGHLVNVLNWITDNMPSYGFLIYNQLAAEAQYRQLPSFAEGREYPQFVDGRWVVVFPQTGEKKVVPPPADYIEAVKDNPWYQKMAKSVQEERKGRKQ